MQREREATRNCVFCWYKTAAWNYWPSFRLIAVSTSSSNCIVPLILSLPLLNSFSLALFYHSTWFWGEVVSKNGEKSDRASPLKEHELFTDSVHDTRQLKKFLYVFWVLFAECFLWWTNGWKWNRSIGKGREGSKLYLLNNWWLIYCHFEQMRTVLFFVNELHQDHHTYAQIYIYYIQKYKQKVYVLDVYMVSGKNSVSHKQLYQLLRWSPIKEKQFMFATKHL